MKKNLYFLFIAILFGCYLPAGAQDTTRSSSCNAAFVVLSNSGDGLVIVSATDTASKLKHYWDFGNGYRSGVFNNLRIAGAAYRTAGTYTITHIVKGHGGRCYDSSSISVTVGTPPDSSCGPVSFSYFADSASAQTIHFIPLPDSAAYNYQWDFGDTTTSFDRRPAHHYSNGSTTVYNVTLTLIRSSGRDTCRSFTSMAILVPGSIPDSGGTAHCSTHFAYNRDPYRTNEVHFFALDSVSGSSLSWTILPLADSSHPVHLTGPAPNYTFPDTGCYIVTLSAVDTMGCQSFDVQQICIDSIPGGGSSLISSYPNPVTDVANIDLKLTTDQTIHVSIFNSMGNLVQTKTIAGSGGMNHIGLATAGLGKGIYFIQVQYGRETRRSRIQKL